MDMNWGIDEEESEENASRHSSTSSLNTADALYLASEMSAGGDGKRESWSSFSLPPEVNEILVTIEKVNLDKTVISRTVEELNAQLVRINAEKAVYSRTLEELTESLRKVNEEKDAMLKQIEELKKII